ncbi:MAG: nucleoside recognition family protein [Oceanospirillaceae bacterium]|uniref:nucleoside recognition family protein n=2 Tax=unclassified Thalassolituus TaxID=2624967 RepID=UPI000C5530E6|nr:nucleoside recognition family protein [Thalassolituus sp. UBA6592]MAS26068.1 nucleoside recognition family protein [Oceanospirillaceae bacterium]MAX98637.1 nucleoside recognition family protein [Oceanospirillaceae bacterium]MBL35485.1 nucleoside recognition family protein [Oceanospirillaceae bacterium]MBS53497.1 nucleoside recognition family protein [Oceanospirillaceae bacterium]
MDQIANTILSSGRSAVELAFFILLPVMIVMLSIMHWLESRGILNRIVAAFSPAMALFGLSGLGIFALMQVSMVSFAAPIATLAVMARNGSSPRHIAATLAMVLSLAQANVVFPMAAAGLNVGATIGIAIAGGLLASAAVWYLFGRSLSATQTTNESELLPDNADKESAMAVIRRAGKDAWEISLSALPLLVVALVAVNLLRLTGLIGTLEDWLAPAVNALGYPQQTFLLAITKYIAGGTAMMGIAMEQFQAGVLSPADVNLLAGLLICPLDVAGVAILVAAGKNVAAVARPAIYGALIGIVFRILCHYFLYAS